MSKQETSGKWNFRLVRLYTTDGRRSDPYLIIADVYYFGGKPISFTREGSRLFGGKRPTDEAYSDGSAIADIRWKLDQVRMALAWPILDSEADFPKRHLSKESQKSR